VTWAIKLMLTMFWSLTWLVTFMKWTSERLSWILISFYKRMAINWLKSLSKSSVAVVVVVVDDDDDDYDDDDDDDDSHLDPGKDSPIREYLHSKETRDTNFLQLSKRVFQLTVTWESVSASKIKIVTTWYISGWRMTFCWFCLLVYSRLGNFSIYPAAVTITGDRAAYFDLCLVFMAFSSEDCFTCHTCCDTGPRFVRYHAKDRSPRPTVGFEPAT
jgi:hypothetical protein